MVRIVLALLVVIASSLPARADGFHLPVFRSGHDSFGLQLGLARPGGTNGTADAVSPGPAFDLRYTRYLNDWISYGPELAVAILSGKKVKDRSFFEGASAIPSEESTSGDLFHFGLSMLGRINLFETGRSWSPFLLGGVGYHQTSFSATTTTTEDRTSVGGALTETKTELKGDIEGMSVSAGGGFEVFLLRGMSLQMEGRWRQFRNGPKTDRVREIVTATIGLRVSF